jgi:hypothetical protein
VTEEDRARQIRAVNRELKQALSRPSDQPWFPPIIEPAHDPEYASLDLQERRSQACRRFRARKRAARAAAPPAVPAVPAPRKPSAPRKAPTPPAVPRPAAVPMQPAPPARRTGRRQH